MGLWLKPGQLIPYVPADERDKPPAEQTTFQLAVLSAADYAAVQDLTIVDYGTEVRRGTHILELLRRGIRGWSGGGAPAFVATAEGWASDASLDCLPGRLRIELANRLDAINTVGLDEGKA